MAVAAMGLALAVWGVHQAGVIPQASETKPGDSVSPRPATLGSLANADRLFLSDHQSGVLGFSGVADYELTRTADGFEGKATASLEGSTDPDCTQVRDVRIPLSAASQFLEQLSRVPLDPVPYEPVAPLHSYPYFFSIKLTVGAQTVEIYSKSAPRSPGGARNPWATGSYVIRSDAPDKALQNISKYLHEGWREAYRPTRSREYCREAAERESSAKARADDMAASIREHVPPADEFQRLLQRDLLKRFRQSYPPASRVDHEMLLDRPDEERRSFYGPRYYVWVRIFNGEIAPTEGVVFADPVQRREFRIHFLGARVILGHARHQSKELPPHVWKRIAAKLGIDPDVTEAVEMAARIRAKAGPSEFHRLLQRDLVKHFAKGFVNVDFEMLVDAPGEGGAYFDGLPVYVWVRVLEGSKALQEGVAVAEAIQRREFRIAFTDAQSIRVIPKAYAKEFPPIVWKRVAGKLGISPDLAALQPEVGIR